MTVRARPIALLLTVGASFMAPRALMAGRAESRPYGGGKARLAPRSGWLESYVSEVDGSRQFYGVFVPPTKPPTVAGYPVVLHMHGYGWWVGPDFGDWQREWATERGWILVNVNGRGPTFYDGIGENDVFNTLADLELKFGIDEDRVYAAGGSMGGTGAYRLGVRRPDTAAAVVGVDGWTDYREVHWHWYARADNRGTVDHDTIEEFRRPLLESISPLSVAPTAQTGNIGLVTDLRDDVVLPVNGVQLTYALLNWQHAEGGFNYAALIVPDRGHCGTYDLASIYRYFEATSRQANPTAVRVHTTQLKYGQVHWARFERFLLPGRAGHLAAQLQGDTMTVATGNLAAFTLLLPNSPARDLDRVRVVVDQKEAYAGPPRAVTCCRVANASGELDTWTSVQELPTFRKTPELEGPIGDAFVRPFVLLYGTAGTAGETDQNRAEAQAFARDWNGQHIHAEVVKPLPEDGLPQRDRATKSLIVFGTGESSSLLREAHGTAPLPVEVHRDRVVVHDARMPSREYLGRKYGCFFVYPNPLTRWRTYLAVSHGLFATSADGSRLQNLGYDLEKLPWAWPDFVVFDQDRRELPYVENVNNKAHTMCYEAGYFVEAGFFDQDWQPRRELELNWVRAGDPHGDVVHVAAFDVSLDDRRPAGATAQVKIVNAANQPVRSARVTVRWRGAVDGTATGVTDGGGTVRLASPPVEALPASFAGRIVNVMATGATYDFAADSVQAGAGNAGGADNLAVEFVRAPAWSPPGEPVALTVRVHNYGTAGADARVALHADDGSLWPPAQRVWVPAGGSRDLAVTWQPSGAWAGRCRVTARVAGPAGDCDLSDNLGYAQFEVKPRPSD